MDESMTVLTDAFVGITEGKITHLSKIAPPEDDLPSCESAEEQLLKEEWFREVAALIQELPMLQRQAVYFCLVLERSPAQLAAVLNVTPHAVSARLYRGLQTMRKKWKALR